MKVQMLVSTNYKGHKAYGKEYEVSEEVAKRWYNNGIATIVTEEVNPYAKMKVKALYALCKERGLEVDERQSKEYYIHALGIADGTVELPDEEDDGDDDGGSDED